MSTPDLSQRFIDAELRLILPDGSRLVEGPVVIEQTRHAFGFGNIGFDFLDLLGGGGVEPEAGAARVFGGATHAAAPLLDAWLNVFDTVTLPFYWRGFEPVRG